MRAEFGLRLHHVGYAVGEIETIAADYARRFGFAIATPVIHDPLQTAFVQFLRLAGDQTYVEFVAPDGPGSTLSGAVKRGGGLHHLCYASGRLEEVIEGLEADGMKLISEPRPAVAFGGRRICWLMGEELLPVELVERRDGADLCVPRVA